MVSSLSAKFNLFKRENIQVGIGGPRSKLNYRMKITGNPRAGGGGRYDDNSNNDQSFTQLAQDSTLE